MTLTLALALNLTLTLNPTPTLTLSKAADADGDGEVSLDEFKSIMRAGPDLKEEGGGGSLGEQLERNRAQEEAALAALAVDEQAKAGELNALRDVRAASPAPRHPATTSNPNPDPDPDPNPNLRQAEKGAWAAAASALKPALDAAPADGPSLTLLAQCDAAERQQLSLVAAAAGRRLVLPPPFF